MGGAYEVLMAANVITCGTRTPGDIKGGAGPPRTSAEHHRLQLTEPNGVRVEYCRRPGHRYGIYAKGHSESATMPVDGCVKCVVGLMSAFVAVDEMITPQRAAGGKAKARKAVCKLFEDDGLMPGWHGLMECRRADASRCGYRRARPGLPSGRMRCRGYCCRRRGLVLVGAIEQLSKESCLASRWPGGSGSRISAPVPCHHHTFHEGKSKSTIRTCWVAAGA